jgi:hypothetical protein
MIAPLGQFYKRITLVELRPACLLRSFRLSLVLPLLRAKWNEFPSKLGILTSLAMAPRFTLKLL